MRKKTEEITEEKLSAAIQKYMKNADAVSGIINKDGNILFSYPASFNGKIRFKRGTGKVDIYWEKTDRKPGFIDDFNAKFHTTYKLTPTKNGFDVEKNPSESDAKLCVKLLDQLKKDFA